MLKLNCASDCDEEFICPELSGSFADPCTCRRYYACAQGNYHRSVCPAGLFWDDLDKICTYKENARCGPIANSERDKVKKEIKKNPCDKQKCVLPYCFCSAKGNIPPHHISQLPQIIIITFDGAVNNNNFKYLKELSNLFNETKHVKFTIFLKHEYTDYYYVKSLYKAGHEIALSSVTGSSLEHKSSADWTTEIRSLKGILKKFADIPEEEIIGIRAPNAKPAGNDQFDSLVTNNLIWDSSLSVLPLDTPIWPYTLDYEVPHTCKTGECPHESYPGYWEVPMNAHYVEKDLHCTFLDECIFTFQSSENIFEWLQMDFRRHKKVINISLNFTLFIDFFKE